MHKIVLTTNNYLHVHVYVQALQNSFPPLVTVNYRQLSLSVISRKYLSITYKCSGRTYGSHNKHHLGLEVFELSNR